MDLINDLLPKIEHFRVIGYWIVMLVCLLESLAFIGLLVPGTFIVVVFGSLAAQGYFDLGDLIWFAFTGAVLGDGISYNLGKKGAVFFSDEYRIFKASYLASGQAFFRRHGAKSVFLGRFIGPIRAVIPFVAGLSGMDAKRFYLWNVLSAFVWAVSHLVSGYFLGHAWRLLEVWSTRVGIFLASAGVFLACIYFLKQFLVKKGKQLFDFIRSIIAPVGRAIADNPGIRNFVGRHPQFFGFIRNRLRTSEFSGLPLSLLGISFIYILLLLLGVIENVVESDAIVDVDTHIANLLFTYRNPILVKAFLWATVLGKMEIILSFAVTATLLFWIWNKKSFILPLWITIGGSYIFDLLGKVAFHRPRPAGIGVYREVFFSFPSGHATISAALFGYFAYFLWRQIDTWKTRLNILFATGILIMVIGFSRLYLGVHFLSDVLGGYLLGSLLLIIGICIRELRPLEPSVQPARILSPFTVRMVSAVLLLAGTGFYVYSAYRYHPQRFTPEERTKVVITGRDIAGSLADHKLPEYTESITGDKLQPLSLIIIAKDDETITGAFKKSGWQSADPVTFFALTRTVNALLFNESYPAAPITPSFWNDQVNDLSFEAPVSLHTVRKRNEARFWKTNLITEDGKTVYVGTACLASGFKWLIVPKIKPDRDTERNKALTDLLRSNLVASFDRIRLVPPFSGKNFAGEPFFTDGNAYVVFLK